MSPLEDTALLEKVKTHELEGLGMSKALLSRLSSLDVLLESAYNIRCPGPCDQETRRDLIRIFTVIAKELYGKVCPVVVEFGSFVMNMFSSDSDLDLSINFNHCTVDLSRKERINALRKFAARFKKLQSRGLVKNVLLVLARVPVLKVTDCGTNIECDFSVDNRDGITKSQIVFLIATIDERFRKLSFMVKTWAKAHGINSSKDGSLNSLSLILLSAFHLQCREPPILPPFSALLRDGCDPPTVMKNIVPFVNYGQKNTESLVQLFVTLLIRLKSVESLWQEGLCVSVYEGSWIHKTFSKKRTISIEDFNDRSQNVARAVRPTQQIEIYKSIDKSVAQIKDYVDGKIPGRELETLLFGPCPPRETNHVTTHVQSTPLNHVLHDPAKEVNSASTGVVIHDKSVRPVLHDPTPTKRKRLEAKEGISGPSKVVRTHDPREATSGPSIGTTRKRPGQSASYTTGGNSQVRPITAHERRYAPLLAHEHASSERSYALLSAHELALSERRYAPLLAHEHSSSERSYALLSAHELASSERRYAPLSAHEHASSARRYAPLSAHEHASSERSYAPLLSHEHASSERSYAPLFAHEHASSERRYAPLFAHEHASSERRYAPLFAHERASSGSFTRFPPLHNIPFDPSPRLAHERAAFPTVPSYPPTLHDTRFPPLGDRQLDRYVDPVHNDWYGFTQPSYPGLERIWSEHPNEAPRRVYQPPLYR